MTSMLYVSDLETLHLEQSMKKRYLDEHVVYYFLINVQRREHIEREVNRLREHISDLKIQISTITKGVPMSKIDVREDGWRDGRSSSVSTTHTARSRRSDKDSRSSAIEQEFSPERRKKLMTMMEEAEKDIPVQDGRRSPLRILKSQEQTARQILMT